MRGLAQRVIAPSDDRRFRASGKGTIRGMRRAAIVLVLAALVVAAAGCGGAKVTTTTNAQGQKTLACSGNVHFARTKFVLHAGLAYGAFHRYILKPYRAGAFRKGADGRTKALVKAGAAALFAYHELRVARTDAVCDGATLRRLATSLSNALASIKSLAALKSGLGLGAIGAANQALNRLQGQASSGGTQIKDISH